MFFRGRKSAFPGKVAGVDLVDDSIFTPLRVFDLNLGGWPVTIGDLHYSLTPPEVRPPTIYFWQTRNITVIGTPLSTARAANRPHSCSCSGKNELAPTANVQLLRAWRTIDATGYSDMKA